MELYTIIKCPECGYGIRASRHTSEQCQGYRKFGPPKDHKVFKI